MIYIEKKTETHVQNKLSHMPTTYSENRHTSWRVQGPHLYVNLVVCGSVYRSVETEANHKYPPVYWEPERENRTGTHQEGRAYDSVEMHVPWLYKIIGIFNS